MNDFTTFYSRYLELFDSKKYRYSSEYFGFKFCFNDLELTDFDIQDVFQISKDSERDFPDIDHNIRVSISSLIVREVEGPDDSVIRTVFYRCSLVVECVLPF